jgi:hypothetical protein
MTVRPSSIKVRLLKFANLGRPDGAFKKTNVYEGGRAGILPHFILVYMEHPCRDRNWQRGIALWPPRRWRAIAVERKAQKLREEQAVGLQSPGSALDEGPYRGAHASMSPELRSGPARGS